MPKINSLQNTTSKSTSTLSEGPIQSYVVSPPIFTSLSAQKNSTYESKNINAREKFTSVNIPTASKAVGSRTKSIESAKVNTKTLNLQSKASTQQSRTIALIPKPNESQAASSTTLKSSGVSEATGIQVDSSETKTPIATTSSQSNLQDIVSTSKADTNTSRNDTITFIFTSTMTINNGTMKMEQFTGTFPAIRPRAALPSVGASPMVNLMVLIWIWYLHLQ